MTETGPARGSTFVEHVDFSNVEPVSKTSWPGIRYDYVSRGLEPPDLLAAFPSLTARDPAPLQWPYLRKDAPHIWRSDARSWRHPDIGVLSVDEASVLFNNARTFSGKRGLEIGCHYGWSTAHLVVAGLTSTSSIQALAIPTSFAMFPTRSRASAAPAPQNSGRAFRPRSFPRCARRRARPGRSRSSTAITRAGRRSTTPRR